MKKILAYVACAMPLLFGGMAAANAQNEIGSASGVTVAYNGPTLTLTGDSSGTYSTHNGSAVTGTYSSTTETFFSDTTATSTFVGVGSPTSTAGENFGAGYFTITQGGTTLLGGTFTQLMFNEFGSNTGDITLDDVDYYGTTFNTGSYSSTSPLNYGSLTFNYPPGSASSFTTTDASTYYAAPASAVPELSPMAIVALGGLGLLGMLFAQGRTRRTSCVSL